MLTIAVVTGALRINHCASVVSYKMDNMSHHKVIHYLGHKVVNIQGDLGTHGGPTVTW